MFIRIKFNNITEVLDDLIGLQHLFQLIELFLFLFLAICSNQRCNSVQFHSNEKLKLYKDKKNPKQINLVAWNSNTFGNTQSLARMHSDFYSNNLFYWAIIDKAKCCYEKRSKELDLFSLEKRRFWGDLN